MDWDWWFKKFKKYKIKKNDRIKIEIEYQKNAPNNSVSEIRSFRRCLHDPHIQFTEMRVFPNIEKHGALFRQNFMLNQTSNAPAMVLWSDIGFPRTQFPTIHLLTSHRSFLRRNRLINEFYYCWLALIQLEFLQYSIGQLTPYATFQILLISIALSGFLRVFEFFWWFFGFLVFWKFSWPIIWCFRYFSFHF